MNLFKNCAYYWGFTAYVAYHVSHPLYTSPSSLQVYTGLAGFIVSIWRWRTAIWVRWAPIDFHLFPTFRFANWEICRHILICVIYDRQARKCAKFQYPIGIHWLNCSSEWYHYINGVNSMHGSGIVYVRFLLFYFTVLFLVRITRTRSAHGFHFQLWPIAFQHTFLHLPVSTKWPFGHWASTKTTRPNSKTIQNHERPSFHSFCENL